MLYIEENNPNNDTKGNLEQDKIKRVEEEEYNRRRLIYE